MDADAGISLNPTPFYKDWKGKSPNPKARKHVSMHAYASVCASVRMP